MKYHVYCTCSCIRQAAFEFRHGPAQPSPVPLFSTTEVELERRRRHMVSGLLHVHVPNFVSLLTTAANFTSLHFASLLFCLFLTAHSHLLRLLLVLHCITRHPRLCEPPGDAPIMADARKCIPPPDWTDRKHWLTRSLDSPGQLWPNYR